MRTTAIPVLMTVLVAAACGGGSSSPDASPPRSSSPAPQIQLSGQVRLASYTGGAVAAQGRLNYDIAAKGCFGTGSFASVKQGQTVEVADDSGRVIGTATLGAGDFSAASACAFPFSTSVPESAFYRLTLPGYPTVTVDKAKAAAGGARISVGG